MTAGAPTIGGLVRLGDYLAGQLKWDVDITGGSISNVTVDVDGGAINNTTIGAVTPASGAFTTLSASGTANFSGNIFGVFEAGEFIAETFIAGNGLAISVSGEAGYILSSLFTTMSFTDAGITLTNGNLALSNASLSMRVQDGSTASTFVDYGLTKFGDDSTAAATYTMSAPSRAGLIKTLRSEQSDTLVRTVNLQASINDTTTLTKLTFDTNGESVLLWSESTSVWSVISNNGGVGYSS